MEGEGVDACLTMTQWGQFVALFFFFFLLFWDLMFCIEGGCDLSGSVLALKFSKSDVIGDGRCVTERKHFFFGVSRYHV